MKSATSNADKAFKDIEDDRSASESSDEGQVQAIAPKTKAKTNGKAKAKGTAVKKSKATMKSTTKSNAKVVKTKAAPKRPRNSYQVYLATEKPRVQEANPDWTKKEVFDFVRDNWHTAKPAKAAGRRKAKSSPPVQEDPDETEDDEATMAEADTMVDLQSASDTTADLANTLGPFENEIPQEHYNLGFGNEGFQATEQRSLDTVAATNDILENQQQYSELVDLDSQVPVALPSYEEAIASVETSVAIP